MIDLFAKKKTNRSINKLSHINSWKTYKFAYIGLISVMVDINHSCENFCEYIKKMFYTNIIKTYIKF